MANYNSSHTGAEIDSAIGRVKDTAVTAGTVAASLGVVVDANKDISGFRNVTLTGQLQAATINLTGDTTIGDANTDNVVFNADVNSNIIPNTDNTYDLGSASQQWKDLYVNGIGYIDQLGTDGDPIAIYASSGEIDGTAIGSESASTGAFTTINASGNITGNLVGNVTGNVSGTAATVTGAAQSAITSVGTLTGLTVSGDVNFDSNTLFVDASENKVSIGTTSPLTYGGYYPAKFSVDGESFTGSMAVTEYQDGISGGLLAIGHSRGTISSKAKLNQNDIAGRLIFSGFNGADFRTITGEIRSTVTTATGSIADGVMAGNLEFRTNAGASDDATVAMTIDSSQRVGIGTTSPNANSSLHIIQDVSGSGYYGLAVQGDSSTGGARIGIGESDSNFSTRANVLDIGFDSSTDFIYSRTGKDFIFGVNSGEKMRITSGGRVGIGDSSPGSPLDVKSGEAANTANFNSTSGATNITLESSGSLIGQMEFVSSGTSAIVTRTSASLALGSNNVRTLYITDDDRVGIGTTSPSEALQVNHSASDGDGGILIVNESTSVADDTFLGGIGFDSADGNVPSTVGEASAAIVARSGQAHGASDKAGHLLFLTTAHGDDDDTGSHERMRVTSEGLVGIGTTNPSENLHIKTTSGASSLRIEATASNQVADIQLYGKYISANQNFSEILFVNDNDSVCAIQAGRDTNDGNGSIKFTTQAATLGQGMTVRAILSSEGDFFTNDGTVSNLSSDARTKKNVVDIEEGLDVINLLRPVSFEYNGKDEYHYDDGTVYKGFIADEIKEVAPFYMNEGSGKIDGEEVDDFKTLSMIRMFPMLVKAVQELSAKVEALENA